MMENIERRKRMERLFRWTCLGFAWLSTLILVTLIASIIVKGAGWLSWNLLTNWTSWMPKEAGLRAAIGGTIWVMLLTGIFSIPMGVCVAIYLEEYMEKNRFTNFIHLNLSNLAGVPSVIYGLLGLIIFVRFMDLGRSLISGALMLSLLVLPMIIITTQEAIKAVPDSIRHAAYALGAKRWQAVFGQVLPAATPGIMTGLILSLSRAIGEAAPLLILGAYAYVAFIPSSPMDPFTTIPIQIFNWASRPQADFHSLSAATIIVFLATLFLMNCGALWIRHRSQKRNQT